MRRTTDMTKQEVYNNIRYNENLVYSYQRDFANLEREMNELNRQIRNLNQEIDNLNRQSNQFENQINELKQLKRKYENLRSSFENKQILRKQKFSNVFSKANTVGFIASYLSGMSDLLSGQEYRRAYNGLSEAVNKIVKKINMIQREKYDIEDEIRRKRYYINERENDITLCKRRLNETDNNLRYRKNRITYWKNQLKYAT